MFRTKDHGIILETKLFMPFTDMKMSAETGAIEGYASRFNQVDQGGDMVMPGAYTASLAAKGTGPGSIKMLWQHDPAQPIGVWDEVRQDDTGLYVKGRILPSVAKGAEALALLDAKAIDGLSIGYKTQDFSWVMRDEKTIRELKKLDLWEVSVVTFPMQTTATMRSRKGEDWTNPRYVEQFLRDGGCSQTMAKVIIASGVKEGQREAGSDADMNALANAIAQSFKA